MIASSFSKNSFYWFWLHQVHRWFLPASFVFPYLYYIIFLIVWQLCGVALDWNLNRKLYLGTILSYFQAIVNHFSQFHHFKQNNRQQSGHYHNFYHKKTIQLPRKHHLSFSSRQRFWWCWQWHPFLQSVSLFEIMYTASQLFLFPILKNRKIEEIIQIFSAFSS